MEDKLVLRINELFKLSKERELTEEEIVEQKKLRKEYITKFKNNFKSQMKNVYIKENDGTITKIDK